MRINADTQRNYPSSMNNIEVFLNASTFAVAGASQDRSKYGNKVFRAIVASGRTAYPLNPSAPEVEGHPAFASIAEIPVVPESLSIVTPPQVTRNVIQQAIAAGVKNIWMQPEQRIPRKPGCKGRRTQRHRRWKLYTCPSFHRTIIEVEV